MMTVAIAPQIYTLEEYFDFENESKNRHEYLDGKIKPMAYTSPNHGRIVKNLSRFIDVFLDDMVAEIWTESRMLYVPHCNKVFYPDGLIVEGEPEYRDHRGVMQATLNPSVLIEVISKSTEMDDRTNKWSCYQTIPGLNQYVLVSQYFMFVECFYRKENGWFYQSFRDENDQVKIGPCEIQVKDVYHKVKFEESAAVDSNG